MTHTKKFLGLGIATATTIVLLTVPDVLAQSTPPVAPSQPAFEVATIKLADPNAVPKNQAVRVSPTRLSIASMSLSWLIYTAYGDGGFNTSMSVRGGPDWVNRTASYAPDPSRGTLRIETAPQRRDARRVRAHGGPARRDTRSEGPKVGRYLS